MRGVREQVVARASDDGALSSSWVSARLVVSIVRWRRRPGVRDGLRVRCARALVSCGPGGAEAGAEAGGRPAPPGGLAVGAGCHGRGVGWSVGWVRLGVRGRGGWLLMLSTWAGHLATPASAAASAAASAPPGDDPLGDAPRDVGAFPPPWFSAPAAGRGRMGESKSPPDAAGRSPSARARGGRASTVSCGHIGPCFSQPFDTSA